MKKGNTIIEVEKKTLDEFQFAKMVWQSDHRKKISNDGFLQILLDNLKTESEQTTKDNNRCGVCNRKLPNNYCSFHCEAKDENPY